MLGLRMPELLIILVVVLIIFGPKNLPKLGKLFGKSVKELRDATDEMTDAILEDEEFEKTKEIKDAKKADADKSDDASSSSNRE